MKNVSRRRVFKLSGALLSGVFVTDFSRLLTLSFNPAIKGWVTRGDRKAIAEKRAAIENFRYSGSSLCNDGEVFECRTCSGVGFYLLVPSDSSQPTVGETYRFSLTGEESSCGNFQVQLHDADSCDGSTDTTETTTDTTTETTTTETTTTETPTTTETTTETTTTETTTETTTDTPTTTETTTDTTTETTTTETTTETPTTTETTTDTPTTADTTENG